MPAELHLMQLRRPDPMLLMQLRRPDPYADPSAISSPLFFLPRVLMVKQMAF
jgi:hypothetical protein